MQRELNAREAKAAKRGFAQLTTLQIAASEHKGSLFEAAVKNQQEAAVRKAQIGRDVANGAVVFAASRSRPSSKGTWEEALGKSETCTSEWRNQNAGKGRSFRHP